jgi:hypothetical protein
MQFCESGSRMRKTTMIPEDASDGEISDPIQEILERALRSDLEVLEDLEATAWRKTSIRTTSRWPGETCRP